MGSNFSHFPITPKKNLVVLLHPFVADAERFIQYHHAAFEEFLAELASDRPHSPGEEGEEVRALRMKFCVGARQSTAEKSVIYFEPAGGATYDQCAANAAVLCAKIVRHLQKPCVAYLHIIHSDDPVEITLSPGQGCDDFIQAYAAKVQAVEFERERAAQEKAEQLLKKLQTAIGYEFWVSAIMRNKHRAFAIQLPKNISSQTCAALVEPVRQVLADRRWLLDDGDESDVRIPDVVAEPLQKQLVVTDNNKLLPIAAKAFRMGAQRSMGAG